MSEGQEDRGREGTEVRSQMSDVGRARGRGSRLRKATPWQGGLRSEDTRIRLRLRRAKEVRRGKLGVM